MLYVTPPPISTFQFRLISLLLYAQLLIVRCAMLLLPQLFAWLPPLLDEVLLLTFELRFRLLSPIQIIFQPLFELGVVPLLHVFVLQFLPISVILLVLIVPQLIFILLAKQSLLLPFSVIIPLPTFMLLLWRCALPLILYAFIPHLLFFMLLIFLNDQLLLTQFAEFPPFLTAELLLAPNVEIQFLLVFPLQLYVPPQADLKLDASLHLPLFIITQSRLIFFSLPLFLPSQ